MSFLQKVFDKNQRSLTAVYIFALSSIALIAILFQGLKFSIHASQITHIEAVRLVEKQKNSVERSLAEVLGAQIAANDNLNTPYEVIKTSIELLDLDNQSLIEKLPKGICRNLECVEIFEKDYFALPFDRTSFSVNHVENILVRLNRYSEQLGVVSDRLDFLVNETSKTLIYLDILFIFLLIIVLVIQAFWGFKPAVDRLNEALSVRSDFISRISHEIRNPMNSIMGMADILKSTNLSSEQKQYVNNLQRSSHVLLDMLNNLVDFSGLENRAIQIKSSKFNIYKMVDKVTEVISVQAHEKNLELFVEIAPKVPKLVIGDVFRLEQVLINLLNNALKFTSKGYISLNVSIVKKDLSDNSLRLKFEIEDTGIGIDQSKLEGIFNSFVQEDSSIKRRFGGSGLGLAISKEIIGLMGSQIRVESEKGRGSKFYFEIDFSFDPQSRRKAAREANSLIYITGLRDVSKIESYLAELSSNFELVREIKDLEKAVKNAKADTKIIVDDSIGIINIINVATLLKRNEIFSNVFALMRSNFSKENMELIRKNGYRNFLIKPFRAWHVLDPIDSFKHATDEFEDDLPIESIEGELKNREIRVLAVDDSNDNLFLIKEILSPLTKNIDFASNGLEACELVQQKAYDIIFMDIQMPIMDGYSAIKKIRLENRTTPVFAVTAHAGIVDEKKCIEAGFTGRITKPINRENIYRTIQNVLGIEIQTKKIPKISAESRMLQKLMPKYFEARMEDLQTLQSALSDREFSTLKKIGHRIKGSAKSYGFSDIGDLSAELEQAADSEDLESCTQLITQIELQILRAKADFEKPPEANS